MSESDLRGDEVDHLAKDPLSLRCGEVVGVVIDPVAENTTDPTGTEDGQDQPSDRTGREDGRDSLELSVNSSELLPLEKLELRDEESDHVLRTREPTVASEEGLREEMI